MCLVGAVSFPNVMYREGLHGMRILNKLEVGQPACNIYFSTMSFSCATAQVLLLAAILLVRLVATLVETCQCPHRPNCRWRHRWGGQWADSTASSWCGRTLLYHVKVSRASIWINDWFFYCVCHTPRVAMRRLKMTHLTLDVDLTGGHFPLGMVFPYLIGRPEVPSIFNLSGSPCSMLFII